MELLKRGFLFERFSLQTNQAPPAVRDLLAPYIDSEGTPREWWKQQPYSGTIDETGFSMVRRSPIRTSWKPTVAGSIRVEASRTIVEVKMSLHPFSYWFTVLWLGLVALVAVYAFFSGLGLVQERGVGALSGGLMATGFLTFAYAVAAVSFWAEAGASRRFLVQLLESGQPLSAKT